MQNTTANYKLEINKPSREFECKITIGNNIYNNDELVNLTLEHTQPQEGFSIGDTISQSLDLTLLNRGDIIYSTSQIKVEIGLKIGSTIEYILMGIFNIDDIEKTDYTTKFTAYDNMIKFETPYFSSLGDKPTLKQVVNELSKITGIEFIGSLPNYTVSKLEGFTCREVLSYVASICGGNAVITRDGKFTIKSLSEIKKSIDGNNYFDYKREEVKYKIGKISCQIDENNILYKGSTGTDSMELGFENPWVTETILNDLYNKLNGLSYLGYSMKWQGDLSLDPYDIVTVTDIKNVIRKIPILSQKISYTGGLTSEIGAKGETKNKNSFSSSGSTVNKVNRAIIEQAIIKEALIEKANIKDVEAVSIRTQILEAKTAKIEEAIIDVAHISDLNTINANIQNLIANDVKINNALINKADITELNAVVGNINIINSELANIKTLVNGNLSSENIQAGGITSDKLTIANGFITNAMIANLDVSKINAGNISTNKFRIVSDNGGIEIVGATQQFKDKNNKVRIQMGQDAKGNFNFILRGEDGTTTLIDHTGIKEKAIADNLIKGNMVATDAIGEKQINYSSLITGLNKDTNTQLIKASKVAIDLAGQTLDLAFNSLKNQADNNKNIIENHSTNISAMQGQISTAINNTQIVKDGKTILLKDDYNRTISKVDSINSTIGTHTTKINELTGNIISVDTKVNSVQRDLEGTKSTVSSHTNLIDGLNSKLSTQGSSIEQLKNQITLKVNSTELNAAINKKANSTDVYTKTEVYTKAQTDSAIKIAKDSIELGVKNTYETKTNVESKISTAVNNVQVGGTNIIKGTNTISQIGSSGTWSAGTWRSASGGTGTREIVTVSSSPNPNIKKGIKITTTSSTTGNTDIAQDGVPVTNGATYTLGCYVRKISGDAELKFQYGKKPYPAISTKITSTSWTKFSYTFTIGKVSDGSTKGSTNIYFGLKSGLVGSAEMCGFKLEYGNKATDWTPAPEDFQGQLDTKANSTDVYTKTETYTKSETDSKITVAKDSINLSVSGTYETKTNVESKINTAKSNAINSAKSYTDGQITTVNKTITNKVSEIKATTDSISQKVSTTESKITTINNNISGLTNRVSTAESKLTSTSLTTTISSAISGGTSSISTTQFVMDKNGLTIKNGALTIKNKAGTTVFSGDTAGNLKLAGSITSGATITGGTLKSSNNDMYFDMNGGYMLLYNDGTKIGQTNKNRITGTSIYGVSNGAEYGKYSTLSAKTSPSDTTYSMMMTVSGSDLTSYISKGVNLGANLHTNNWHFRMGKSSELCWRQSGAMYDSFITEGAEGMLRLYGDNGMYLGYREGANNLYIIAIRESGSHTYPKALSIFNSEGDIPSKSEYSVEITAPLKMKGQTIDECSNIKTLGLEIVEPLAFYSDDSEETTTTYTVTKNNQNIVEFVGSTEIVSGEVTVPLPDNMVFRNYVVLLTPIGSNRNVSLVEKSDDSFKLIGDNGTVDYVIKFESVDYSKYMAKSISINTVDNIQRSEDDLPKVIELSEDSSPFIDVPTPLEAV